MIKIGRFIIEGELGRGGFGAVYKARMLSSRGFEKPVAIKTIFNPTQIVGFLDEAKVLSMLNHENICQVYDLIEVENAYFMVMEYINGYDLDDIIKKMRKSNS